MKTTKSILALFLVCIMGLSMTACWDSESENAVEEAQDTMGDAMDDAGDAMQDAGEEVKDEAEDAAEAMDPEA